MDASHLIKVVNEMKGVGYILPVHDCFGTHPNQMPHLADIVRTEFVKLYSNGCFLESLYNKFIKDVKNHGYEILEDKEGKYVEVTSGKKIKRVAIPALPERGNLDINLVKHSKYMIN